MDLVVSKQVEQHWPFHALLTVTERIWLKRLLIIPVSLPNTLNQNGSLISHQNTHYIDSRGTYVNQKATDNPFEIQCLELAVYKNNHLK